MGREAALWGAEGPPHKRSVDAIFGREAAIFAPEGREECQKISPFLRPEAAKIWPIGAPWKPQSDPFRDRKSPLAPNGSYLNVSQLLI